MGILTCIITPLFDSDLNDQFHPRSRDMGSASWVDLLFLSAQNIHTVLLTRIYVLVSVFFHDARSSNSLVPGLILGKFSLFGRKSLLRQSGGLSEFVQKIKLNFLINTWHSLTKIELSNVSLVENYLKISSVWTAPLKIWYYENITVSGEFVLRDFALLVSAWCEWVFGLYLAGFSSFGDSCSSNMILSCKLKLRWQKLGQIEWRNSI